RRNNKKKLGETLWGETAPPPTPTPTAPVLVELTSEEQEDVSWEDIASVLSTSIKKDKAPKLITFCAMLLAQTNEDQLNLGYQAESSTGKSYIPIEVSTYFPPQETELIASASPTAFYHDGGQWDAERKVLIKDLAHKNLIFLDMPSFQLLEKLRPMLSHDKQELRYMITDKNQKHGLRTKNVIIKGYPSVFFCSTKQDPDEQEKTRMLLLSPSVDQEKLRESLALSALRKSDREEYEKTTHEDPQRLWLINRIRGIRQWGIKDVIIPGNGNNVLTRFMSEHQYLLPRHQRDFPRIFSFIKAHALLNCFKREKKDGRNDTILANDADIDAGFALYKEVELSNELGLSPYIFRIYVDVVAPLLSYDGMGGGVTREDIIKQYYKVRHKMLSPDILRKEILPQLEIVGLIRQEPDENKKSRMLVYPTVSTTYTSEKIAESEGRIIANYTQNIGGQDSGVTTTAADTTTTTKPKEADEADYLNIKEIVDKVMLDSEGNNKGYFTKDDFVYSLIMRPNEHWTEGQAEQTLYQLLQESKVTELEPGKFKPSISEGDA
ncbi:MAG TPA: hypothetical protein VHJ59_06365, partial [Nitrososphaera sp.]|nr:hypothetical protein [Nitrososphaera sp.]